MTHGEQDEIVLFGKRDLISDPAFGLRLRNATYYSHVNIIEVIEVFQPVWCLLERDTNAKDDK